MERLSKISKQLGDRNSASSQGTRENLAPPSHTSISDVVICCALRTPITKAKRGGLAKVLPEDMLVPLFKTMLKQTRLDPSLIGDICIGNVLQPGAGALSSRIAELLSEIPDSVPISTVNRQCSSGLQAVANIAGAINSGYIDIGIAGGVESMTHFDMASSLNPELVSEVVFEDVQARNCLLPMGITSENVAEKYNISRFLQDKMATESHAKAYAAAKQGFYKEEIVPVPVKVGDAFTFVSADDGIRAGTTLEALEKLKPSFKPDGTTHAGNSSQISDGAALVLLARQDVALLLGLPILAKFVAFSAVGVPPDIMGIGPSVAIPAVLKRANMSIEDIDIFEINEAFASQAVFCVKNLKIPENKLNPKGGAIALGHPLGATGARQIATLLPELRRTNKRYGVVSMCVGTGMGCAAIIENLA